MAIMRLMIGWLFFLSTQALASSIAEIDVHVRLDEDGSARVVQTWQVDVHGKGSEFYIPQGHLGDMEIQDFSVTDESGQPFINEGLAWNSQRSAAEKEGRYGMTKVGQGYELCWGRGQEGPHTYRVAWTFTRAIKAYEDYDGFNLRLVNDQLSPLPEKLKVTIEKPGHPFEQGAVHMWAFGFKGSILPVDGKIVVTPEAGFSQKNYINVMLRFDKGIFAPVSTVPGSFQVLVDKALQGTAEESEVRWWVNVLAYALVGSMCVLMFVCLVFLPLLWLFRLPCAIFMRYKYGPAEDRYGKPLAYFENLDRRELKRLEATQWQREIPCNGNLLIANLLMRHTAWSERIKKSALLEACLLRFIQRGLLRIEPTPGRDEQISLRINQQQASINRLTKTESSLFNMLIEAAGLNGILEIDEFSRWGRKTKNATKIHNWMNSVSVALDELRQAGGLVHESEERKKWFGKTRETVILSSEGKAMLQGTIGFRKYLLDFTLVNEKRAVEVALWDDYLVFAALFGCAQQVSAELLRLKPEFAAISCFQSIGAQNPYASLGEISTLAGAFYSVAASSCAYQYSSSSSSSSSSSYSSSSGGSSYSSGGGGSSGGGSGGGER